MSEPTETVIKPGRPADLENVLRLAQQLLGWTREEVTNVISNVLSETPDKLMDDIGEILEWCHDVEKRKAVVDVMKTLPAGVLQISWRNGEPVMRFSPELDIRVTDDGAQFDLKDSK